MLPYGMAPVKKSNYYIHIFSTPDSETGARSFMVGRSVAGTDKMTSEQWFARKSFVHTGSYEDPHAIMGLILAMEWEDNHGW